MEYNKSPEQIMAEFKKKRTRQIIAIVPMILAFIGIGPVSDNSVELIGLEPDAVIGISIALLIGVIVFSFINWRCPSCDKYMGRAMNPKFCSKCGTELR